MTITTATPTHLPRQHATVTPVALASVLAVIADAALSGRPVAPAAAALGLVADTELLAQRALGRAAASSRITHIPAAVADAALEALSATP